ncbi:DNA polymerase eta-like [Anneissia japonica]|uniref:DNA polymerase eta-like n=1 Tax=Anneissia japonica TaxID=1529436 RepID=UPI0014256A72|nr:DNA polymerase eta-like [Anneissia japonica]
MDRIIALIDMDCFYVQVEQRLNNSLRGKPCAVVQYNQWKGGGIIAVSYEARAFGVTRQMRGDEAKDKCPDIHLVQVPESRGKANLDKYREAGAEVIKVLCKFSNCVERASIDEAYIDLTEAVQQRMERMQGESVTFDMLPNTHVVGWDGTGESSERADDQDSKQDGGAVQCDGLSNREAGLIQWLDNAASLQDKRLAVGGYIVEEMRAAVYNETSFRCSGGIAHNKMLAKLCCGFNKPNKQTITPHASVEKLFQTLPIRKVRHLGGKLGLSLVEDLNIEFMGDLCRYSKVNLQTKYGDKTGLWLYEICRGLEYDAVKQRTLPKSIGCSKNFTGKSALDTKDKVKHWLGELANEVAERITKDQELNNRVPKQLTVSLRQDKKPPGNMTRSCALSKIDGESMAYVSYMLIQSLNTMGGNQMAWVPHILSLGIVASKFTELVSSGNLSMKDFLNSPSKIPNQDVTLKQQFKSQKSVAPKSIEKFFSPVQKVFDQEKEGHIKQQDAISISSCKDEIPTNLSNDNESLCLNNEDNDEQHIHSKVNVLSMIPVNNQSKLIEQSDIGNIASSSKSLLSFFSQKHNQASVMANTNMEETQIDTDEICSEIDNIDEVQCEKCSLKVTAWDYPEHLDYHFAMDLQKQISDEGSAPPTFVQDSMGNTGKRCRVQESGSVKKKKPNATASIASYFTKP